MQQYKHSRYNDLLQKYQKCKNSKHIFRNTNQLNNIIQAAATDINVETKVQPIWEQIRQKKDYFATKKKNRYWDVQTSLNIYDEWCKHHGIDVEDFGRKTFEFCHKIRPKINGLHITGVSNSGKSYILRSIRNGLMNCGCMRCQASNNFNFGSCVDKTLIYTDEMWFTPQNVEEGKCILEGTETYVNVKHQNERLLKRTLSLSTSNGDPWRHVQGEANAMNNRVFIFWTYNPMPQLQEWGATELNPIMWLTIWKDYISKFVLLEYKAENEKKHKLPEESGRYRENNTDTYSPAKK